jgi:cobalamin biosynthesis protein CobD/CbiB
MSAITKASPAAITAAPRRWFHTVQWVRKAAHWAGAPGACGLSVASELFSGTLATAVMTTAAR